MDHKSNNRKSKAPWQLTQHQRPQTKSNRYVESSSGESTKNNPSGMGDRGNAAKSNFLSLPNSATANSRKHNRRMSIHASAMAAQAVGLDSNGLPPIPSNVSMYRTATDHSDLASVRSHAVREKRDDNVVEMIKNELRSKDATAIDDFYRSLVQQKAVVERNVKDKINENQKNILQLTDNLQVTQQQLLSLRIQTKELYGILGEFSEAAERRLELEAAEPGPDSDPDTDMPDTHAPLARNTVSKKRDRSSVLVLQKMWAAELQSLYKHVDGAQKYVQVSDDRHVLAESGRWNEVHIGTWKSAEPVHLFLLNDAILVATRKKNSDGGSKRLQAAHYWPLATVELAQITPPTNAQNSQTYVLNLRSSSHSYVYQTDRYDHFVRVTSAYQRGKQELARAQRLREEASERPASKQDFGHHRNVSSGSIMEEGADKRQLRDSLRTSGYMGDRTGSPAIDVNAHRTSAEILLKDISSRVHQRNRSHDFMKQERMSPSTSTSNPAQLFSELKLNEDRLDEVDVHLAHNEYVAAVDLIQHIEGRLSSVFERIQNLPRSKNSDVGQAEELRLLVDVVKLKITSRKGKVQQGLLFDLRHTITSLTVDQIANMLEFYLSFDNLEDGIGAILGALSSQLARMVARLTAGAHGSTRVDIVNYLSNLIIVHVSVVTRAAGIYKQCIVPILQRETSGSVDSSGFVTWSIGEMERLAELIKKHASGSLLVEDLDQWRIKDTRYYDELLHIMQSQLDILKKEGLNVDYMFDDIMHCAPIATCSLASEV